MTLTGSVQLTTEQPTKTIDNIQNDPGLTPGGLDPANNIPTLGKLQAGSAVVKLVVAIEGCKYLLSDAPSASVLSAWAGTDHADVLGGLFVELQNTQSINPDDPYPVGGRCVIKVLDTDHTDVFGIYLNKRTSGDHTTLRETADRNDSTLTVSNAGDFASSGTAYIGTESIAYTGTTSTTFTGVTRGQFAAFGCDSTGSGGRRFARHHRVSSDINTTLSNPVVSEVPRNWVGKHVSVYLHTWDEATEQLNTKANAQLIYAGRLVGIADDPDSMATILDVEHIAAEFKQSVIGKDLYSADLAMGIYLVPGRKFQYSDTVFASPATGGNADDLDVVASGASGAYEVNAGYYEGGELAGILSRWLAQAKTDGDIAGAVSVGYAISSNVGIRSKIYFMFSHASTHSTSFGLTMPGEVAAFFGFTSGEGSELGQSFNASKPGTTNVRGIYEGTSVPFSTMIMKPFVARIGQEFASYALVYELENERGAFIDQFDLLPASIRGPCASAGSTNGHYGLFLVDEKILMVGLYDYDSGPPYSATLTDCWVAPFQLVADNSTDALGYIGRRVDEPPGPLTLRQVLLLEGPFKDVINKIVYSTGASGYNHSTYDVLSSGIGVGLPGSLLGPEWERSLANLPGADSPICVAIDEPTKFADLFRDDFRLRRAFVRWHDQGFEFATWHTPLVMLAEHDLTEDNKAAPAGQQENHRIASVETDEWYYPVVKVDYARDFGSSRNATYLKSIQLEDQSGSDGGGGTGRSLTLKMRNTFAQRENAGAAVEELIKEYLAGLPMFSRPARKITRTIDLRYYETIAVGDIVTIDDSFMRDPLTGARGGPARAGIVTRISYDLGGPTPDGKVRDTYGDVEIFFLDTHRSGLYSPCAEIHNLVNHGGFSAGYKHSTAQIWVRRNEYANGAAVDTRRGPVTYTTYRDTSWFEVDDVIQIVECDPSDTTSPTSWNRTISAIDGDVITLSSQLTMPSWDATKRYRVFSQTYDVATTAQKDFVFQADSADEMIDDTEIAYQYSSSTVPVTFTRTSSADKAEFVADLAYGDGKPLDVGTDAALAKTANAFIDYKSAHQSPFLWTSTMGPVDETSTEWATLFFGPVFLGSEYLSTTITRVLSVAPWFRSRTGATAKIRTTIVSVVPTHPPSDPGGQFDSALFADRFSQSFEWSTTSTTWQTGTTAELNLTAKDYLHGFCWLIVQGTGYVQCRGLAKCVEGPRSAG